MKYWWLLFPTSCYWRWNGTMHRSRHLFCLPVLVVRNPPGWEVGIYLVGFFVLLCVAGINIWKLWKSGTFPAPSPFPNFDYRYLQEKYGTSFSEVRQKVPRLLLTIYKYRISKKQWGERLVGWKLVLKLCGTEGLKVFSPIGNCSSWFWRNNFLSVVLLVFPAYSCTSWVLTMWLTSSSHIMYWW